mgnify:CR=1 FL=1
MASLIIISWRDIPAQVIVKQGRATAKVQLTHRFQEAVDRAAMRAGKGSSDAYLADWKRSDPRPVSGDLDAEARAEAEKRRTTMFRAEMQRWMFALLGTAAGGLALTVCATGGVYLAGGILPQLSEFLARSHCDGAQTFGLIHFAITTKAPYFTITNRNN